MNQPCAVFWAGEPVAPKAADLAGRFGLPVIDASRVMGEKQKRRRAFFLRHIGADSGLFFLFDDSGLKLVLLRDEFLVVQADFHGPSTSYRRREGGGRGQMIARAVGLRGGATPCVCDATAGLGSDAFVLASLGCRVEMIERVPAVRALLGDALERGTQHARVRDSELLEVMQRLSLIEGDSLSVLAQVEPSHRPDVVYLDPMFPERSKSAAVKKEMQVFHRLVGRDPDADQLLPLALEVARSRVVVKRPRVAPLLGGMAPDHVLEGRSSRFDVYIC